MDDRGLWALLFAYRIPGPLGVLILLGLPVAAERTRGIGGRLSLDRRGLHFLAAQGLRPNHGRRSHDLATQIRRLICRSCMAVAHSASLIVFAREGIGKLPAALTMDRNVERWTVFD
ncbi:hypothetical protein N657DRAFT_648058 [Parathielavia appendiculata]|uniref:Uncharacterized protein n=1 Tax=Parathielavia appendiculata TaxID=2587402 RepID=A0AAN6TW36_9PEZI|nr:hypothetical protein N657DRAFT_648058 [Parathielavia appendiculata]